MTNADHVAFVSTAPGSLNETHFRSPAAPVVLKDHQQLAKSWEDRDRPTLLTITKSSCGNLQNSAQTSTIGTPGVGPRTDGGITPQAGALKQSAGSRSPQRARPSSCAGIGPTTNEDLFRDRTRAMAIRIREVRRRAGEREVVRWRRGAFSGSGRGLRLALFPKKS